MIVIRPHNVWTYFQAAAANPADTYLADWAVDGNPNRPLKGDSNGGVLTLAGTAAMADTCVLCNHNIESPATAVVSGDLAGAFVLSGARRNRIPFNPYLKVTPASVDALTLTISGNYADYIIGEFIAGLSESFDLLQQDNEFGYQMFNIQPEGDIPSVMPTDLGARRRRLQGTAWATLTEKQFVEEWIDASMGNTRPSVIIPNPSDNDAWVVKVFAEITYRQHRGDPDRLYLVNIGFEEWACHRW